jgi:hypothetical protein
MSRADWACPDLWKCSPSTHLASSNEIFSQSVSRVSSATSSSSSSSSSGHVEGCPNQPSSLLLAFEPGSLPPVVGLGDRAASLPPSGGSPDCYWAILDVCRWGMPGPEVVCASHDVPQSLAEETAVLSSSVVRAILLKIRTPSCPVSKVRVLPERHFQVGHRFRSWQNR